jgi:hypothetical protein
MTARNSTGSDRGGYGFLWVILFAGLIVMLFSALTWPFRAIARRLPGRREKELQTAIDELQADIRASQLLLEVLGRGDSKLSAKLYKRIAATEGRMKQVVEAKGWPEDLDQHGPGELAVELLAEAGVIEGMDWRSAPDDLRMCLTPLLERRGISLDWNFVKAIEATNDGEALRNTNFLPIVGDHVEKLGFVLVQVVEGSDSYTFAVCSPDEFTRVDGLTCSSFTIRRLSSATGPAKEP